ncbi:MAG: ABC transporter permease [Chloroflexi bacterium]|nr:ABC transporter permease [Chloroflexota bacterium]
MIAAQTRVEVLLALRRGESVLITLVIPTALMLFFGTVDLLPIAAEKRADFLVPGILALAVMSTAMVSLGIGTAFERYYRVLKRLGGSPLTRPALLTAKILGVLTIEALQVLLVLFVAVVILGWHPAGRLWLAVLAFFLGTAAFGGLGLLMAGTLRAETTLAVANGLYLAFLLIGGVFFPLTHLPAILAEPAQIMPAAALADVFRSATGLEGAVHVQALIALTFWAIVAPLAAALTFRWE